MFFYETINNWNDWAKVYQSISAFEGVTREIFVREHLPFAKIEHLTPGTNAVFKVGETVIKIYAPKESGMDQTADRNTEIFVTNFVEKQGLPVAKILAEGTFCDTYTFAYIVMKWIAGNELGVVLKSASAEEQYMLGKKLRGITDKLNISCEPFNDIDILRSPCAEERWHRYPQAFKNERRTYIDSHDYGKYVLVHGDLCMDNILVADTLVPIDYADAVFAPMCYEHALIFFEYRDYPRFLKGYFAGEASSAIAKEIFDGILIHGFGGVIVENTFGDIRDFLSLAVLQEKINTEVSLRLERG